MKLTQLYYDKLTTIGLYNPIVVFFGVKQSMEEKIEKLKYILELLDINPFVYNLINIPSDVLDIMLEEMDNIKSHNIKKILGARNNIVAALIKYATY